MKKKTLLLHTIGFLLTFLLVSAFLFYQTFVNFAHQRVALSVFLRPKVLLQAMRSLKAPKEPFDESALYWQDGVRIKSQQLEGKEPILQFEQAKVFIVNGNSLLTGIVDGKLTVRNVATGSDVSFSVDNADIVTTIGWRDSTHLVLDVWNQTHSIWELNTQTQERNLLVSDIVYNRSVLPISTKSGFSSIIYPDCSLKCYAVEFDLENRTQVAKYPLFTEPSHAASLDDVRLLFADVSAGFIGYELPGNKEVYIIDRDLNLLQLIRQENDRNEARFLEYFPQTQQMLFVLTERITGEQTVALSAVNTPSLHVLTKFAPEETIIINQRAGVYQIGENVYDLNGDMIKHVGLGKLIKTY